MDYIALLIYIILGLIVGILVGLTGMGGGAIMTPLLIFSGVPPINAVGTDLLFSTITKLFGSSLFYSKHKINTKLALTLYFGSIPAIFLSSITLHLLKSLEVNINFLISIALGIVLISISAITLLNNSTRKRLKQKGVKLSTAILIGFIVGFAVQFTSVGSGTLVVFFLLFFSNLTPHSIVGTNILYSFLLTSTGVVVHFTLGTIDYILALILVVGSLPGTYFGFKLNSRVPIGLLKKILSVIILLAGIFILILSLA
ncbi:MAG: sulfite exporter TauE/SafE family protein [Candidatus Asgardarchaeia archaeon]